MRERNDIGYLLAVLGFLLTLTVVFVLTACMGRAGTDGDQGAQGNQGATGPAGSTGPSGPAGVSPALPVIISTPADASQCPTGGVIITVGPTDNVICNGLPGGNASSIQIVQFCPGVTPNYPTSFPEIGLVIAGDLYAVYSDLGGYLFKVVPGVYHSNAIGSSCDFTVNLDGSISH